MSASVGGGYTEILAVIAEAHPFNAPTIVNVDVCRVVVVFVNTPGIENVPPGPAGSMPTRLVVLSLVQLKDVAVPPKLIVAKTAPEQTV
jgi:hypothetical protein